MTIMPRLRNCYRQRITYRIHLEAKVGSGGLLAGGLGRRCRSGLAPSCPGVTFK